MSPIPDDTVIPTTALPDTSAASTLVVGTIVVAALYFGQELLVPLVLAALLAFVLAPGCALLQRTRLPRVICVLVVVAIAFAAIGGIGVVVGNQVAALAGNLPSYQTTVMTKWYGLTSGTGLMHRLLENVLPKGGNPSTAPSATEAASVLGLERVSGLAIARTLAQPLLGPLATAGVVLVFTIFMLLSNEDLRDRLVRLVGRRDLHRTILAMNDAAGRLSRYFLFQLMLNGSFGIIIGLALWWTGLPNPVLWGILAAMMRFVPFIGTFIAIIPPLLLAIAVVPGWTLAFVILGLFIGTELVMGQIVEPLIYGHSTGLSPIAVIVATAFWAFLWGPVGLLMATPLTVCLVVIGRHVQPLAFLDVILGDTPPLSPEETFYQRALEGKAFELTSGARTQIAATSRTEYYDTVALRGLALAQRDLSRDALAFERLEEIHSQIATLLSDLSGDDCMISPPSAADWQLPGVVVCIPGRGQLDDLAATMATQALGAAGFGVRLEPNVILGSSGGGSTESLATARLCCLSVIEEGSTASGIRYFVRRMEKTMPDAMIVVCLWHAPGDSPLLADLRSTGGEEHLVRSIGELLALAQAMAARPVATA
ncbi:AI-2E family transporter [Acidisphaera sp. L21]|uniref:AI-2E family transporter n=1 Tax=Acidisphaera sp. L21 TaxID=1641851 RepID=UPI00131BFEA8|nr:AI-2E family transporter [Acidisphaera sp. L21]